MGAGQETNGLVQSALAKEGECPFLVEEKQAFTPPSFDTNPIPYNPIRTKPKGRVAVVQMSPDWGGTVSLVAISIYCCPVKVFLST